VFIWFKTIELLLQLRPKAISRLIFHPNDDFRHAIVVYPDWTASLVREVAEFLFNTCQNKNGPSLGAFMGGHLMNGICAGQESYPPKFGRHNASTEFGQQRLIDKIRTSL